MKNFILLFITLTNLIHVTAMDDSIAKSTSCQKIKAGLLLALESIQHTKFLTSDCQKQTPVASKPASPVKYKIAKHEKISCLDFVTCYWTP